MARETEVSPSFYEDQNFQIETKTELVLKQSPIFLRPFWANDEYS